MSESEQIRSLDVHAAIGLAAEFMRRDGSISEDLRVMLLRSHMDARRALLGTLRGVSAVYLASSFVLMACVPILGWWIALPCLPLSLLGAADGRAYRALRYQWLPPIVVPALPQPTLP